MMPVYRDGNGAHHLVQLRSPPDNLNLDYLYEDYRKDAIFVNSEVYSVIREVVGAPLTFEVSRIYVSGKDAVNAPLLDTIDVVRFVTTLDTYRKVRDGDGIVEWIRRVSMAVYFDKNLTYASLVSGCIPAFPNQSVSEKLEAMDIDLKRLEKDGKCVWLEGILRKSNERNELVEDGLHFLPYSYKYI